ncbi:D-alanyl-D-alanine carboxypeptidase/D-alanyl-D-alanine-endopeptidase [Carboxylicivirga sp. M1479]|uniref:D-alanyl-D-alanine carboxypeptidase/D-alanyl-D-alanine endopeptidase n=1 Tax=Carboxylicivirga sp. M1479 TaxID=2594476 RepID=UPI001177E015|nr:D-alanyl-D-alanine carboxypeptidase/D-alanyl-D-alanine-endopeptidase [Carboxylicivirga sp. M1479]TRX65883.1 D-alanyl-D-alanine carboxypeptidase/D-alanyl-D-alanine-endopeptidase [Carboxylicivirga sp. M1479]
MRLIIGLLLLVLSACSGQSQQVSSVENTYSLDITKHGSLSAMFVNVSNNNVILGHQAQQRMTPASLTKVFTTGAAINVLHDDYRFTTQFYLQQHNDKLHLLVVGGGDPTLGSVRFNSTVPNAIFQPVLAALKKSGVKGLQSITVDNSYYSGIKLPSKRLWEDMANYYGAVPNGLSYRENTFHLSMQSPKGVDQPVEIISVEPSINKPIVCKVRTAANNKDSAYIYGHSEMSQWYVSGSIPQDRERFSIKGALPNPELTLANELQEFLNANGVKVVSVESQKGVAQSNKLLYKHQSPSLAEIISVINKKSHNLMADHLLFELGRGQVGKADWDSGALSLNNYWNGIIPDFTGEFFDGSGLSPFNAFSAKDMVMALKAMDNSEYSHAFKQSLSIAGTDGTLRSILKEEAFQGKVIGKSGSMNGVLAYCGYLTCNSGQTLAFCIMANRFTEPFKELRQNMENLMKEIILQN